MHYATRMSWLQTLVQGMAAGNNATLAATPYAHCTSNVYVIDTVLLPTDRLADIPRFSRLCAWLSHRLHATQSEQCKLCSYACVWRKGLPSRREYC